MPKFDHVDGDDISLLVIQCDERCDLDRFSAWLGQADVRIEFVRPYRGETIPTLIENDGLIVLGGELSAVNDEEYPWLSGIRSLQRLADQQGVPGLGICLGAQLLAQAFGGTVKPGSYGYEIGATPIRLRNEAKGDPLLAEVDGTFIAPSFHIDAITSLPSQADWLAEGEIYRHQAFRIGSSWGVQFHPEITPARLRRWNLIAEEAAVASREELEAIAQAFDAKDELVAVTSHRIATNFLSIVRSTS